MKGRLWRVTLPSGVLMIAFSLAFAGSAGPLARAQGKTVVYVARAEMIDAIMHYAGSGGCDTLRSVFGSAFDEACNKPGSGTAVHILALAFLGSQQDQALIEICQRNKLVDCEEWQEASTGRPVLAFDASFSVHASRSTGAWSPDSRRLIIYAMGRPKGQTRLIDIEQKKLSSLIAEGAEPSTVAWSPDGKYVALGGHQFEPRGPMATRLFASDTLEEIGNIATAKEHQCGFALSKELVFTTDSLALWVSCSGLSTAPGGFAIAIKLGVPGLEIKDRLFPAPLAPDTQSTFQTYSISRRKDDLVLTGIYRPSTFVQSDSKQQMAVQSYSLRTKEPLHPPVLMPLYHEDGNSRSIANLRSVVSAHLTEDQRGVLVRFYGVGPGGTVPSRPELAELWSTEGRGKLEAGPPAAMLDHHLGPPNRIASRGSHIGARAIANSWRRYLLVLDSHSGDAVQEIGPVPSVERILVAPDGTRVAIFGRREIRFYRVDLGEAAAAGR